MKGMKRVMQFIYIFIIIICLLLSIPKTYITGDGEEYLTMTISFKNHLSFNKTQEDDAEAHKIIYASLPTNEIPYYKKHPIYGYFSALSAKGGGDFSYHFWGYSLLCTPVFVILSLLKTNPLETFKITNLLLILLMFYWVLFRNNAMRDKNKVFLALLLYFSPLWFYYKWTHPEVFTFTFLMIGLIDYYNKRLNSAVLFTALSSVQNPAAAIVPFFMMLNEMFKLIKNFSKTKTYKFVMAGLIITYRVYSILILLLLL